MEIGHNARKVVEVDTKFEPEWLLHKHEMGANNVMEQIQILSFAMNSPVQVKFIHFYSSTQGVFYDIKSCDYIEKVI